jgi:integrase
MPPRKCWSKTVGVERGTLVRVYERKPGGILQIAVWVEGGTNCNRQSLRHRDRTKAEQQARTIAQLRGDGTTTPEPQRCPATLGDLFDAYLAHATHTRRGCLITEDHRRDLMWRAVALLRWFGHDCVADELTRARVSGYMRARRAGQVGERAVRARTVRADLTFLKSALAWACGSTDESLPLVTKNALAGFVIPGEPDPRRPVVRDDTAVALLKVAPVIHPLLPLLLIVIGSTGRRLSSVLGLEWADIDLELRAVVWRAELDKGRKTWESPLPAAAADALAKHRAELGRNGGRFVFPSSTDPHIPVTRHLAADWLLRAYRRAGIEKQRGTLWHSFRRKWATQRKHYPIVDVAAAGGWKDLTTLLTCYQQPDPDTMRAVIDRIPIVRELSHQLSHHGGNANGAALITQSSAAS